MTQPIPQPANYPEPNLSRYYITYGTSDNLPYQGGWTVIYAKDEDEARQKHIERYGLTEDGYARFAFSYTEEEFLSTSMYHDGNCGAYTHEVIE